MDDKAAVAMAHTILKGALDSLSPVDRERNSKDYLRAIEILYKGANHDAELEKALEAYRAFHYGEIV